MCDILSCTIIILAGTLLHFHSALCVISSVVQYNIGRHIIAFSQCKFVFDTNLAQWFVIKTRLVIQFWDLYAYNDITAQVYAKKDYHFDPGLT